MMTTDAPRFSGRDPFVKPTMTPAADTLAIGLPVTYEIGRDRYALVIVAVERNGATVKCAHSDDNGEYPPQAFTRRGDGSYRLRGQTFGFLYFGVGADHRDPSF